MSFPEFRDEFFENIVHGSSSVFIPGQSSFIAFDWHSEARKSP
jgi:hypothetical protein